MTQVLRDVVRQIQKFSFTRQHEHEAGQSVHELRKFRQRQRAPFLTRRYG